MLAQKSSVHSYIIYTAYPVEGQLSLGRQPFMQFRVTS